MKVMKKFIAVFCILIGAMTADAQFFQSSYFLEGMAQRHYLNPALTPERNYVSVPLVGNLGVDIHGNLDLKDLVMPREVNGQQHTVTFLHPEVSLDDLHFRGNNVLMQDARVQVLGAGFRAFGGYNTLGVNLREYAGLHAPQEMFTMLKSLKNQDYRVGRVGARGMAWMELSAGHSHAVNRYLRIGATAKLLIGMARIDAQSSKINLNLSNYHRWTAAADAQVDVSIRGFSWGAPQYKEYAYRTDAEGHPATYQCIDIDNVTCSKHRPNGLGAALDLGLEYSCARRAPGLKFSLALVDVGAMRWRTTAMARNNGTPVVFEGFQNIALVHNHGESIGDLAGELVDRATDLYVPQDAGYKSLMHLLGATMHIGLEYTPQKAKFLKFGLLCSQRIEGQYSSNEARFSAALVGKLAELEVSGVCGTYGPSFGWVLNFKPRGFNVFVGMDRTIGRMAHPFIPLKSNASVSCGINVPFGKLQR